VGEAYPFVEGSELVLLWDNHNSVHGIREFARSKGATTTYVPVTSPEMRADEAAITAALKRKDSEKSHHRLFAYPAQSNFTGVQHPLEWIKQAQDQGCDVLLDAAAFVPTNRLDLSRWHPDFVPVSFYKMFGYPSGAGCLLARKEALSRLNRPWFAGGTVWGSSVQADGHVLLPENEGFEDGTINYLNLPAVRIGLRHLMGIGMTTVHKRVEYLTGWLLKSLLSLHHSNGKPLILIYGPQTTDRRGGTITFNFLDPTGRVVDERVIDRRAIAVNLSLRTGCFCNPGAGEAAFRLSGETLLSAFSETDEPNSSLDGHGEKKKSWDTFLVEMGMPTGGGIRVSLGLVTNFADVFRFIQFACTFLDNMPDESNLTPRVHC
jgi:selenocysteine lyase/cysteine desulfurase